MDSKKTMELTQDELLHLYHALKHHIKTVHWDLDDADEWSQLVALKNLEERVRSKMDDE
jgi:hypothetical protein